MPQKRDMIFICRKGNQPTPISDVQEEEEDEEIREEDANVDSRGEKQGEVGTSRERQSKFDVLLHEFEDLKVETISKFDAMKQQLQANQVDNASKFDLIVQMLEGIQAEIQSTKHQLSSSPVRFSNPPSENSYLVIMPMQKVRYRRSYGIIESFA